MPPSGYLTRYIQVAAASDGSVYATIDVAKKFTILPAHLTQRLPGIAAFADMVNIRSL